MRRFVSSFNWRGREGAEAIEEEEAMAERRWMWCTKCGRETWHAWLEAEPRGGWYCAEPRHWNPRWHKVGDALAYLQEES